MQSVFKFSRWSRSFMHFHNHTFNLTPCGLKLWLLSSSRTSRSPPPTSLKKVTSVSSSPTRPEEFRYRSPRNWSCAYPASSARSNCTKGSLRWRDWQRTPEALVNGKPRPSLETTRRAEGLGAWFPSGLDRRETGTAPVMDRGVGGRTASALFAGFRALGLFSNDIPHAVRFSTVKRRFYVTTCVGKSFHTYDVSDFFLPLAGNHPLRPPVLSRGSPALLRHLPSIYFCRSLS